MNPLAILSYPGERKLNRSQSRRGFTLIELLIAVVLTLIIILVMVRLFKSTGDSIGLGRAKMDMHNQIRVVTETLRRDLQNATHLPNPSLETSEGYFEIVEGPETDAQFSKLPNDPTLTGFLGDHDDVLAMTVKSSGEPFRGRFGGDWIESPIAEIIWWVEHDPNGAEGYDANLRLYRRVILVRPDLNNDQNALDVFSSFPNSTAYWLSNDVSVSFAQGRNQVFNSLEDLSKRQNRFAHDFVEFPYQFEADRAIPLVGDWQGQDLMLNNCTGFDVKVFDPRAFVSDPSTLGQVVDWDDPGFYDENLPDDVFKRFPSTLARNGGYVNLGYLQNYPPFQNYPPQVQTDFRSWFSDPSYQPSSPDYYEKPWTPGYNTYCTWFAGYESDGENQNNNSAIDEGFDGVDNDGNGIIDDNAERETLPPYAYPIRSLEVRVRMIEKKSNLVLQQTVRESFVPN